MHAALQWLRRKDRNLLALRRALRAAIVMPAMFATGTEVIGNPTVATFAAFGSFALILLVDFGGPMHERLQSQLSLCVAGAVLVCLGTLASRAPWLAALAMAAVAFAVLFAGVVSSVLAGAGPSLLLAFILPVSLQQPPSAIPDQLAGWALASGASLLAVGLLWPAPERDPMRAQAASACRALAARLRADVDYRHAGMSAEAAPAHLQAVVDANEAVAALRGTFLATPWRPTGLSTPGRAVVRLVDEIDWLNAAVVLTTPVHRQARIGESALAVKLASAAVLEQGAAVLGDGGQLDGLVTARESLRTALAGMEAEATQHLPVHRIEPATGDAAVEIVSSLDPSFRMQELSFAVGQIAGNIERAALAERRGWLARILGRQPDGIAGTFAAAHERAVAHLQRNSVWLHNSVRGAVALGAAIFVANETGVQHSFWVVLGTLSVLRSNALNTGQNIVRGLLGTVAGFVVGGLLLVPIGTDTTVLWSLLPVAIFIAGAAPAVISFAAGQAGFTITLVILFNIIEPSGWQVGLVRVEDVALGCGVSLLVGLLFWPRGAAAALGTALAEGYADSSRYLAAAVDYGVRRCARHPERGPGEPPRAEAQAAAAAARRLDDTFRTYLAERGPKPVPLAEMTGLITGVAGLRLAADAIVELWERDRAEPGDRAAARQELLAAAGRLDAWFATFASGFTGGEVPEPADRDQAADGRLIDAVRRDLTAADGVATATAVRVIWTGDHLDAIRRVESTLVRPARTAIGGGALAAGRPALLLGARRSVRAPSPAASTPSPAASTPSPAASTPSPAATEPSQSPSATG